jgi:hypothetical protein
VFAGLVEDGQALVEAGEQDGVALAHGETVAHIVADQWLAERADVFELVALDVGECRQAGGERRVMQAGVQLGERLLDRTGMHQPGGDAVVAEKFFPDAIVAGYGNHRVVQVGGGLVTGVVLPDKITALQLHVMHRKIRVGLAAGSRAERLQHVEFPFLEELHQDARRCLDPPDLDAHDPGGGIEQVDREAFAVFVATEVGQGITVRRRTDDDRAFEAMDVGKIRPLCLQRKAAQENQSSEQGAEKWVAV